MIEIIRQLSEILVALGSGITGTWVVLKRANAEAAKTRAEADNLRATATKTMKEMETVSHEVQPNTGGSIKDSVERIEGALKQLGEEFRAYRAHTNAEIQQVREDSNLHAHNVYANRVAIDEMRQSISRIVERFSPPIERKADEH